MANLDQLPTELLEIIFQQLECFDLCALACVNRDLNLSSLQYLFDRNRILNSTQSSITITGSPTSPISAKENTAIIQGLLLAVTFPFSPKHLSCTLHSSPSQFVRDLERLQRLVEKINSLEEIELDFQHGLKTGIRWEHTSSRGSTIPIRDLLDAIAFKCSCQKLTLLNGQISPGIRLPRIDPPWMVFGWQGRRMNNLVGTLVGFGRRFWSPNFTLSFDATKHSNLRVLNIHSQFLFHFAFIDCAFKLLTSHSIEILSLRDTKTNTDAWFAILPHIHLPNLKELYFNNTPMDREDVTTFLTRHRSLVKLDFGYFGSSMVTTDIGPPWFFLPNVTTLGANPEFLGFFLRGRTSLSNLRELVINMRIHTIHQFYFAGMLSKIEHKLKLLDITVRISLENGSAPQWLPLLGEENVRFPRWSRRVKKVIIEIVLSRFLNGEEETDIFVVWLRRFQEAEILEIQAHDEERDEGKMKTLAQRLRQDLNLNIRTLQLNDEAKLLEEWDK
ncbi:hypothetical protein BDN72DRAFT_596356 [Pluteus cervinus]|uniref:Uncharacterized protein n=1 Tax=Pluteus cervinus TaxID=181527 RepID=A0ACD3AVS5_9AGAR|nr:hypothetical protein BDN72DRAFT_596356 [Pluteus cervinus]